MRETALALLLGMALDLLLGDPHFIYHPVRAIGWLIQKTEDLLRRVMKCSAEAGKNGENFEKRELTAGVFLVIIVTAVSVSVPWLILEGASYVDPKLSLLLKTVFCYQLLAAKSLYAESRKVEKGLEQGDIEKARQAVAMIVGRDTDRLDRGGIARAAVETVAENTSDGVIAPFVYMAIFGPVGGFFYKAVNTMDSMVGYKNERYLYFGRAAAKLDDLCNFIPARLTALFMTGAAFLLRYDGKNAWKIYKRDRYCHASPNSAHGEAVCAGALHLRLAGNAWYFGKLYEKPSIGDPDREIEPQDIRRTGRLMFGAEGIAAVILLAIELAAAVWI